VCWWLGGWWDLVSACHGVRFVFCVGRGRGGGVITLVMGFGLGMWAESCFGERFVGLLMVSFHLCACFL